MSKFCPICNKEWPDEFQVCPVDGTALINKPQTPSGFSLNLGDANAISGGVNMSDNHSVSHNTVNSSSVDSHNVITNHITHVEREKSREERLNEGKQAFREACKQAFADGMCTSEEKRGLDDLRFKLGLDDETAAQIFESVRTSVQRKSVVLGPIQKMTFEKIKSAILNNKPDIIQRLYPQLVAMVQKFAVEELQYTYYMLQAILTPEQCVKDFETHREDKYWQTFWASVAYRKIGDIVQAESLLVDVGSKWTDTIPEENTYVLAVVGAILDNDMETASSLYEQILGGQSIFLEPLVGCLYGILYADILTDDDQKLVQNGSFYREQLFSSIPVITVNEEKPELVSEKDSAVDISKEKETVNPTSAKVGDQEYAEELFELGNRYYEGNGVDQDYKKAVEYYSKASERGHSEAMKSLGTCFFYGKGVDQDYNRAFELYTKSADLGNIKAQYNLGVCYEYGDGVAQDYKKAVEWYTKAAEQGYDWAQCNLGVCYYNGNGVAQDYKKAVEWYTKAAEQGYAWAQCNLSECYYNGKGVAQDYKKAVEWFTKAAEQGYAWAQCNLGECYYNGDGVAQDYKKAVEWYTKAAEQGYALAQYNLGVCYYNGNGVAQDYKKAVGWYTKAAEQGNSWAQCCLGECYENGNGVRKNYKKAVEWYARAAEKGDSSAQTHLGFCYEYGRGVTENHKKAVEWYTKAAKQGDAYAQYFLGDCYYYGKGVKENEKIAKEWYTKAADQGNESAKNALNDYFDS